MPSTRVAFRITSALISMARRAAAVSVEKIRIAGAGGKNHDALPFPDDARRGGG